MNFLELIPFVNEGNLHIATSLLVLVLLFIATAIVYGKLRNTEKAVVPDGKFSLKNMFEVIAEFLLDMAREIMGEGAEKYLPFVASIFVFILTSNLLGLIPGFLPPTENMNTNLACAAVVFIATHYFGVREHGFKYVKKFMAPVAGVFGIFLSLLFIPIEVLSNLFRPMSLSIRLFGNINGDHTVLGIFSGLVPVVVPVIFMVLGLLVAVVQAFIFTLLSMVYISLAVSHDH